jgi:hypothetical protein
MYKIFLIFFILLIGPLKAEQFTSIENFTFALPKGYQIFNKNNLYDVYNHSNNNPLVKKQINLAKQSLKNKRYVITSGCWDKCNETKEDLFNLVKSIKF